MIRLIMSYLGKKFGIGFSVVLQPLEVKRTTFPQTLKRDIRNRY